MNTKTSEAVTKLLTAIASFAVEALILKWIWNGLGPDQGLAQITWLGAMGWMMIGRGVLGTGAIKSAIASAKTKKD
jgi:hypothetical protein